MATAERAVDPESEPDGDARLERWERRTRPLIIAAAVIPLIGITTGTEETTAGVIVEVASWLVFVVDLIVHMRLRRHYLTTGMGRFDLAVVVLTSPWYLIPGVNGGRFAALLRLVRLARVLMATVRAPRLQRLIRRLGKPFLYIAIAVFVSAAIVMRAEHHKHGFSDYGDSLWWAVVTVTTVGYGDIVPESEIGRLTATLLMFTGVALLGTVAASLASMFRSEDTSAEEAAEAIPTQDDAATSGAQPSPADEVVAPPAVPGDSDVRGDADVLAELRVLRAEIAALREAIERD